MEIDPARGGERAPSQRMRGLCRPPIFAPFCRDQSSGVFAVGDVCFGSVKRVASAVGESAMAIHMVHERLANLDRA